VVKKCNCKKPKLSFKDDLDEFNSWRCASADEVIDETDESYVTFFVSTNEDESSYDVEEVFHSLEDAFDYYRSMAKHEFRSHKNDIKSGRDTFTIPTFKCVVFQVKAKKIITVHNRTGKIEVEDV
jgi:hypothetical protein